VARADERVPFTIFVTRNRRSPVVGMWNYNEWPAGRGFRQVCQAGVKIATRYATQEEHDAVMESPRHLAYKWDNLRQMLWDERDYIGEKWFRILRTRLREKRREVLDCMKDVERKKRAHARKLAKRRGG
jgi:hypothetical protein